MEFLDDEVFKMFEKDNKAMQFIPNGDADYLETEDDESKDLKPILKNKRTIKSLIAEALPGELSSEFQEKEKSLTKQIVSEQDDDTLKATQNAKDSLSLTAYQTKKKAAKSMEEIEIEKKNENEKVQGVHQVRVEAFDQSSKLERLKNMTNKLGGLQEISELRQLGGGGELGEIPGSSYLGRRARRSVSSNGGDGGNQNLFNIFGATIAGNNPNKQENDPAVKPEGVKLHPDVLGAQHPFQQPKTHLNVQAVVHMSGIPAAPAKITQKPQILQKAALRISDLSTQQSQPSSIQAMILDSQRELNSTLKQNSELSKRMKKLAAQGYPQPVTGVSTTKNPKQMLTRSYHHNMAYQGAPIRPVNPNSFVKATKVGKAIPHPISIKGATPLPLNRHQRANSMRTIPKKTAISQPKKSTQNLFHNQNGGGVKAITQSYHQRSQSTSNNQSMKAYSSHGIRGSNFDRSNLLSLSQKNKPLMGERSFSGLNTLKSLNNTSLSSARSYYATNSKKGLFSKISSKIGQSKVKGDGGHRLASGSSRRGPLRASHNKQAVPTRIVGNPSRKHSQGTGYKPASTTSANHPSHQSFMQGKLRQVISQRNLANFSRKTGTTTGIVMNRNPGLRAVNQVNAQNLTNNSTSLAGWGTSGYQRAQLNSSGGLQSLRMNSYRYGEEYRNSLILNERSAKKDDRFQNLSQLMGYLRTRDFGNTSRPISGSDTKLSVGSPQQREARETACFGTRPTSSAKKSQRAAKTRPQDFYVPQQIKFDQSNFDHFKKVTQSVLDEVNSSLNHRRGRDGFGNIRVISPAQNQYSGRNSSQNRSFNSRSRSPPLKSFKYNIDEAVDRIIQKALYT